MMIRTMFAVLPKVMKSVLPKVSVQSVRSVWFLDVAWSDAFGVALSDAGARFIQQERGIWGYKIASNQP